MDSNLLSLSHKQQQLFGTKLDFKNNCIAGGTGGAGSLNSIPSSTAGGQNLCLNPTSSPSDTASQQFNIFPAIFSRQLNFTAAGACSGNSSGGTGNINSSSSSTNQGKLMDELRPNLVGGLLGLQQGLLDEHALAHGNLQHSGHQETKFMSLQDNRLMGITSHENRLLGLSQDLRSATSAINSLDNNKNSTSSHQNRKCSSTPEDFTALYGGLASSALGETHHHHHTPAHTPPSRITDHTITGKYLILNHWKN